jgi:hypothetical protein
MNHQLTCEVQVINHTCYEETIMLYNRMNNKHVVLKEIYFWLLFLKGDYLAELSIRRA